MKFHLPQLAVLLLLVTNYACNPSTNNPNNFPNLDKFDTTNIALFVGDATGYLVPIGYRQSPLTETDLSDIENLLSDAIRKYNNENRYPITLEDHKRQYKFYLTELGEREVWVNCFCNGPEDWRTRQVVGLDPYGCYFDIRINLSNKTYDMLSAHGRH